MPHTKMALAGALKKLTHEKPFDRISVSDITERCDLNRQTFYYHFQDKYECLEWIYLHDCLEPITHSITIENWEVRIEMMLSIMMKDKEFYMRTIHASPKTFIDPFFTITKKLFWNTIHMIDEADIINDEEEEFISEFLAHGSVGMVTAWIDKGMKTSPQSISGKMKRMANDMEQLSRLRKRRMR